MDRYMDGVQYFTSLSTAFKMYQDNRKGIIKGCLLTFEFLPPVANGPGTLVLNPSNYRGF